MPFGLRTAVYIFNLFAEVFQWILVDNLEQKGLPGKIAQYLDDFWIILSPTSTGNCNAYSAEFTEVGDKVGLSIKVAKNEERTEASFGGIEMDTQKMVIWLLEKKPVKAQQLIQNT